VRTAVELRQHYADKGGFNAVQIKIRLPDGRIYGQTGKLDFQDNTVSQSTDTIILRGTIPNPPLSETKFGNAPVRELVDGEFVTVLLEGVQPVQVLTVPRAAVLTDQSGNYVFTVDGQNKVQQTPVQLGQSTPTLAAVVSGLQPGDRIILDGVQRVHAGQVVSPGPASPPVTAAQVTLQGATGR
jgi:membrane fusion protein, multidrug efflux system